MCSCIPAQNLCADTAEIENNLIASIRVTKIRKIYSHPQVFGPMPPNGFDRILPAPI